jgi:ribosome maturation factor RimP
MLINKMPQGLELKFQELCRPIVEGCGLILYHLEYHTGSKLLRLYVMNPQTQSAVIEDCVKVDHALSEPFEKEDWIPKEVTLEVSSPGVYRPLSEMKHFEMSLNQMVAITITGQLPETLNPKLKPNKLKQKKYRGTLQHVASEYVELKEENEKLTIPFELIKKAQLDPDFDSLIQDNKALQGGRS